MRFLVIQTAFLGDVVLTTPLLDSLLKIQGTKEVHVVCIQAGAHVLNGIPNLITHTLDKKNKIKGINALFKELKGKSFDAVFCVHRSPRSLWIGRKIKAKKRIAFRSPLSILLGYKTISYPKYSEKTHYIQKPLELLKVYFPKLEKTELKPTLTVDEKTIESLITRYPVLSNDFILISPFSTWATKEWLLDRFFELGVKLSTTKHQIVFIGGTSQREIGESKRIEQKFNKLGIHLLNLVGKTSIEELKGLIFKTQLLVSNDSAPIHIAAAFERPVVSVFGPTVKKWGFFPLSKKSKVIEVQSLSCRPCSLHGPNICPKKHFRCMNEITVEQVFSACKELLNK